MEDISSKLKKNCVEEREIQTKKPGKKSEDLRKKRESVCVSLKFIFLLYLSRTWIQVKKPRKKSEDLRKKRERKCVSLKFTFLPYLSHTWDFLELV